MRRQFVIGIVEGLKEVKKHEFIVKKTCNRLKRNIVDVEDSVALKDEFELDSEKPCTVEEKWNKKVKKTTC